MVWLVNRTWTELLSFRIFVSRVVKNKKETRRSGLRKGWCVFSNFSSS